MNKDYRLFTRADGKTFWDFLESRGIPYRKEDFPFLTENNPPEIKPVLDFDQVLRFEYAAEVVGYLYKKLGRGLAYIGPVVDSDFDYGFNDHSDKHTLWVALQTVELLSRAGTNYDGQGHYDAKSEVLATLAGMLHDIGNLVDRKQHSQYSIQMLEQLFIRKSGQYDREWQALLDAIRYHEEPVLLENNIRLKDLSPLQWALVIADKLHYGRDRVSRKMVSFDLEQKPMEQDWHLMVNSMIARSSWHIEAEAFVFQIDFSITEFSERFANYLKDQERLWVPDPIYDNFANSQKTYRESFTDLFTKLYGERMNLAAEAAFLLFPWLETFKVRISDNDARDKVGSGMGTLLEVVR